MRNDLLRRAREKRGWTRRQLAEKLRVGTTTVQSWESGDRFPSLQFRGPLCDLFGMTAVELGLEEDETEQTAQEVMQTKSRKVGQDPNRQRMLKRVRRLWIRDVLDRDLQGNAIHLHLREQPDAVVNPWAEAVQQTILTPGPLSIETHISDVYDDTDGSLLILGEPGAGKTTMLLELARDLLERADLDNAHPMPVVFHLSSWARKRAELQVWLVDELQIKYQVPRKLAASWVSANQILPLLDGLDEVAEDCRAQCLQAINMYHREQGFASLVVCSRSSEYLALSARVALNSAITIEPLSWEDIENYLSKAGKRLEDVKIALKSDPGLQEMASTPLMLQIIAQTFRVTPIQALLSVQDQAKRRALIFEKYIEIVLKRRGQESQYSAEQTIHWLSQLATYLQKRNETEFYLERMQQDWLEDAFRQKYHHTLFRIIYGIQTLILAGLYAWLRGGRVGSVSGVSTGLLGWLGAGSGNSVLGWMAPGMGGGLEGGGMLGIIFVLAVFLTTIVIDSYSHTGQKKSWKSIQKGMVSGLKNAFISGAVTAIATSFLLLGVSHENLSYSLPRALGAGLCTAMIFGPTTLLGTSLRQQENRLPKSKRKWTSQLLDGLTLGACAGLGFGAVTTIQEGLAGALLYTALISIASAFFGIVGGASLITIGETKTAETVLWSWQNIRQHMVEDTTNGVTIGLSITLIIFFTLSLASGLFYGPEYGISYGMVYSLITGFIVGSTSLLTTILNRGWSSTMLSQDRLARPNEGIRRSLRHSLFAGFIFGPIGGLASGLAAGLAFGLIGGLPGWPLLLLAIGLSIVFTLILTFQFTLMRGGIACIEHYTLRWFLWRNKWTPLRYARFLNYAAERILLRRIGGGYMFTHRLILEYFAGLESETK